MDKTFDIVRIQQAETGGVYLHQYIKDKYRRKTPDVEGAGELFEIFTPLGTFVENGLNIEVLYSSVLEAEIILTSSNRANDGVYFQSAYIKNGREFIPLVTPDDVDVYPTRPGEIPCYVHANEHTGVRYHIRLDRIETLYDLFVLMHEVIHSRDRHISERVESTNFYDLAKAIDGGVFDNAKWNFERFSPENYIQFMALDSRLAPHYMQFMTMEILEEDIAFEHETNIAAFDWFMSCMRRLGVPKRVISELDMNLEENILVLLSTTYGELQEYVGYSIAQVLLYRLKALELRQNIQKMEARRQFSSANIPTPRLIGFKHLKRFWENQNQI